MSDEMDVAVVRLQQMAAAERRAAELANERAIAFETAAEVVAGGQAV